MKGRVIVEVESTGFRYTEVVRTVPIGEDVPPVEAVEQVKALVRTGLGTLDTDPKPKVLALTEARRKVGA